MKESIGYTVTINIMVTFIIILFAFLSAALIYFKSNKVSNIITSAIERYAGYSYESPVVDEISAKLSSIGYNKKSITCKNINNCQLQAYGENGYCVYSCDEEVDGEKYYYYRVRTNMMLNIPIINEVLDIPIFSNTNRMYDFEQNLGE